MTHAFGPVSQVITKTTNMKIRKHNVPGGSPILDWPICDGQGRMVAVEMHVLMLTALTDSTCLQSAAMHRCQTQGYYIHGIVQWIARDTLPEAGLLCTARQQ